MTRTWGNLKGNERPTVSHRVEGFTLYFSTHLLALSTDVLLGIIPEYFLLPVYPVIYLGPFIAPNFGFDHQQYLNPAQASAAY